VSKRRFEDGQMVWDKVYDQSFRYDHKRDGYAVDKNPERFVEARDCSLTEVLRMDKEE